jgi:Domain of unknown function (DUF5671)
MENHTAKHFVLQLGSLVSLYLSVSFLVVLLFGLINLIYPDAAEGYWAAESAASSVRLGIAMVIVFLPTYFILTRIVNENRRTAEDSAYLGLTKWLIYLSLLVGGIVLLGDLVAVVMAFLEGELTERFLLKAGVVLITVGAAFYYYLLDARGYWLKNEQKSIIYASAVGLIALVSVGFGFAYIETPSEVREQKLDQAQLNDLQEIQYQIENYINLNQAAPESLERMVEEIGVELPQAPELREPYVYETTLQGFKLCAAFAYASTNDEFLTRIEFDDSGLPIKGGNNWTHPAGRYCFERVVTPTNLRIEFKE